jgi:hypothetical protein
MNKAKTFLTLVVIWAVTAIGSGTAQAVTLGEPGEALLIPGVNYDSVLGVNTLVGITIPSVLGVDPLTNLAYATAPGTSGPGGVAAVVPGGQAIHWFFFDENSVHRLDNGMPATADDFVPFDWGGTVVLAGATELDGVPGYLVFTNTRCSNSAGTLPPTFAMYGDAVIIQGNWASAAYVPVMPMNDRALPADAVAPLIVDNVVWGGGTVPAAVSPLVAGIQLDNDDGSPDACAIDMRYFCDPALGGGTDLVVWMDRNYAGFSNVSIDVFDTEEQSGSYNLDLSDELNIIDACLLPWTTHVDADGLTNEGFVYIELPEITDDGAGDGPEGSCVAYSLIYFSGGATAQQVQTALAHERGVF